MTLHGTTFVVRDRFLAHSGKIHNPFSDKLTGGLYGGLLYSPKYIATDGGIRLRSSGGPTFPLFSLKAYLALAPNSDGARKLMPIMVLSWDRAAFPYDTTVVLVTHGGYHFIGNLDKVSGMEVVAICGAEAREKDLGKMTDSKVNVPIHPTPCESGCLMHSL